MPLDLQRLVGPVKFDGAGITVNVDGIAPISYHSHASVTNVPSGAKTTILSQAYVASSIENILKVSVSGEVYAKYFLTLNGTDIDVRRTGSDRNLTFDFMGGAFALTTGDIVDIKVEHYRTGLYTFESTLYGYAG